MIESLSSADAAPARGPGRIPAQLRGYPGVGVLPQLFSDPLRFSARAVREHGGLVRLSLGPAGVYLVGDPEHAQHVLRDNAANYTKHSGMWDVFRSLAGEGLGTIEGAAWLRQRRMMQPLFSKQRLGAQPALMTAAAREGLAPWSRAAQAGARFDIGSALANITMRVVLKSLFSTSIHDEEIADFHDAVRILFRYVGFRMWTYFVPAWVPLPGRARFHAALSRTDRIIQRITDERRRDPGRAEDLLSLLLGARDETTGAGMSDRQIRDEAIGFLVAGSETTANALTWALYLLDQHPQAERTLRAELDAVLGGRTPQLEDLGRLTYTRSVFQEALRLYPPAWVIPRRARGDDVIGAYRIPAGTTVAMLFYAIHRHPAHWTDPDAFQPERFADGTAARSRAYLPFGAGARQCIGNHFAVMQGTLLLSLLLQQFRIRLWPGHPVEPQCTLSLQPRYGLHVRLEPLRPATP